MSALIDTMAYRGQTPWHGLGARLPDDATIEQWIEASGLTWTADMGRVFRELPNGDGTMRLEEVTNRRAIYRSDTQANFEIVSDGFNPYQPRQVTEFFRDVTDQYGYSMETLGALKGGAIVWGLAANKNAMRVGKDDTLKQYLLCSTGFDRTHATHFLETAVRVVCNNTLRAALHKNPGLVIPHSTKVNEEQVKKNLSTLKETFAIFEEAANKLAERRVTKAEVENILNTLFLKKDKDDQPTAQSLNVIRDVTACIVSSPGAELETSRGTAWGVLNGVTHYVDFFARRSDQDRRLQSAWFGAGAEIKADAFKLTRELVKIAA